jgi:hypothetical protein
MNEDALTYRLQRGLDQQDEQMALLVQRVSGSSRSHYFFPDLAGVGISYNTFVWKPGMDPGAGMLRLVLGMGTRAVNRVENDYPRLVALDTPLLRPHAGLGDTRKYSQHEVDVLDVESNQLEAVPLKEVMTEEMGIQRDLVGVRDSEAAERFRERGVVGEEAWILTFDNLLSESPFPEVMRKMLKKLEDAYDYPVDVEFTANFSGSDLKINLVQCRPLQTMGEAKRMDIPIDIEEERILFSTEGGFMGSNAVQPIARIITVDPEGYTGLSLSEKYDIARLIGKLNRLIKDREATPALLMGPGRWGTTTPTLGVPVRFSEINNIAVMAEIEYAGGSLIPELSFGSHFFQDLVETNIFYVAIFPGRSGVVLNRGWTAGRENALTTMVPEAGRYANVVQVYDVESEGLYLMADIVSQRVVCFSSPKTDQ